MNLEPADLELIKVTVRAAVSEATGELVTKFEFRDFRNEMANKFETTYSREMIDRFREESKAEIDRLWEATKTNQDVLSTLWQNAWVKVSVVIGVAIEVITLWQLFHK